MALPEPENAYYPTEEEIRDTLLRTIKLAYLRRGKPVNVLPGSDHHISCTAMARVVALAFANNKVALRDISPLTAKGENLIKLARVFGVEPRPPSGAAGYAVVSCSGSVVIPGGFVSTAKNGKKYATVAPVTVSKGQTVAIQAKNTGKDTDQEAGTVLSWDSAAVGALASTAVVALGGLKGGNNGDDDETLRDRLLARLAFPAAAGNWSCLKGWAEEASSAVSAAFVYEAVRGPCSVDIALVRAEGDRTLGSPVIAQVAASVAARFPGHVSLNVTSVQPQFVDVSIAAKLPLPVTAGGTGGGWMDAAPWPADDARIALVSGSTITVAVVTAPAKGQRIGIWNPTANKLVEFAITSTPTLVPSGVSFTIAPVAGGVVPAWVIPGLYVSAGAVNLSQYADALYAAFLRLGPGEKSQSPHVLPRALRKPPPDIASIADLTSLLLSSVTNLFPEILSLSWGVRRFAGTMTAITSPPLPVTAAEPPYVLVVRSLAFRKE